MTLPRLALLTVAGIVSVAAGARADEARYEVQDHAGLFSPDAVQKAEEQLRQIPDEIAGLRPDLRPPDFVVETVASPPEDVQKQLQEAKDNAQKERCLNSWAARKADDAGVNGVYVLICKDVVRGWFGKEYGYPAVILRPEGPRPEFTAHDAWRLQSGLKSMTSRPDKVKDRDARLLAAVAQVRGDIRYNLRPAFPWAAVGGIIAGVLGLWGVLGLVRMRLPAAGPPEPRRPALWNGLLGCMFGTAAAHWIYDTLFVAGSAASAPDASAPALPLTGPEPVAAVTKTPADAEDMEPSPETAEGRLDLAAHDEPADGAAPTKF